MTSHSERDAKRAARWAEMERLEPALAGLAAWVRHIQPDEEYFCPNEAWAGYGDFQGHGLKMPLQEFVGFDAREQTLRTSEAYEFALNYLLDLLPRCRNCGCLAAS